MMAEDPQIVQEIAQGCPHFTEAEVIAALPRLLDGAAKNGTSSVITRDGEVTGAVIGGSDFRQFLAWRAWDAALRTRWAVLPTGSHSVFDEAQTGYPVNFTRPAVRTLLTECSPDQIAAVLSVLPQLDRDSHDSARGELLSPRAPNCPEVRRTLAWSEGGVHLWVLHWVRGARVIVDVSREGVQ